MSQMVRTQIYLPRDMYDKLRQRSQREGIAMAEQIRLALGVYLADATASEGMLRPDDPLWELVGLGEGPADASREHDRYIYGWEKPRR